MGPIPKWRLTEAGADLEGQHAPAHAVGSWSGLDVALPGSCTYDADSTDIADASGRAREFPLLIRSLLLKRGDDSNAYYGLGGSGYSRLRYGSSVNVG